MTEKELLEWKLPVLDMHGTSGQIHPRETILPDKILRWKNFENSFKEHDVDSSIKQFDLPNINPNIKRLESESSLQSFIKDVLNNIFSNNILSEENEQIEFGPSERNEDADIVMNSLKRNENKKRLIDIEVKNPPVLYALQNQSLYDYCISSSKRNQKPWYALNQLYGYMIKHEVKYGMLTTYNQTWYLKHEKDKIYISNTILKNELLKSMNYFISLSLENL